jgi:hypothetical protein
MALIVREYTAAGKRHFLSDLHFPGWPVTVDDLTDAVTVVGASDLLTSDFGAELVILNLQDGVYYGLEDVGARIWSLLQKPTTIAAIREVILSEYEVEPARCEQDLRTLLERLISKGLVRVQEVR